MDTSAFRERFLETLFDFSKLDIYKCPKSKTKNTFGNKFVTENCAITSYVILLLIMITKYNVWKNT